MNEIFELPEGVDQNDELQVRAAMVAWARERTEAMGYKLGHRALALADRYVLGEFTDEELFRLLAPKTLH